MPVFVLSDTLTSFPSPRLAENDGLLAIGGDLSEERLLKAYKKGIFPWFSKEDPILWWSPDPRLVLYPEEFKISKSLKKIIKQNRFQVTVDTAFENVITQCRDIRIKSDEGTWIVNNMATAYTKLHESGFAHSVETWYKNELVGGLYGVSIGKCFFGESMFTKVSNASKVAFARLVHHLKESSFHFIDCQVTTRHLESLGAREISRNTFLDQLKEASSYPTVPGKWSF